MLFDAQNGSKMKPKLDQIGLEIKPQNGAKIDPKWHQIEAKIEPKNEG